MLLTIQLLNKLTVKGFWGLCPVEVSSVQGAQQERDPEAPRHELDIYTGKPVQGKRGRACATLGLISDI